MPYIPQHKRTELNDKMDHLLNYIYSTHPSIGEINFIISSIINNYIEGKKDAHMFNYNVCNKLIGVLECAKLELYRKVVSEYEEVKINENGPLYD